MIKLLKNLNNILWPAIAILVLLAIQAYGDLALPEYMADIVDVGIARRGVPDADPLEIAMQVAAGEDFSARQTNYLTEKGVAMIGISALIMITGVLIGFLSARTGASVGKQLRDQVFRRILSFSNKEMDSFTTASLITRSTNDIQQVQWVAIFVFRMIFHAPIVGIGGVLKVSGSGTGLGWIIGVAVGVTVLVVAIAISIAMPKFKQMPVLIDRLNLVAREILSGVSVIRAFGREDHEEGRFEVASKKLRNNQLFVGRVMALMHPVMMLIMNGITIAIVWFAARGIEAGNMMVGDMMAFIAYTLHIMFSFIMLTMAATMLPRAMVSAKRIEEILSKEISINDPINETTEKPHALPTPQCTLSFENVSFGYPEADELALEGISFTARPGETTAIIGGTGSGKSTLVNLIPRFYDVSKGRITVDGTDVRAMNQATLRSLIGYVPQNGVLFSGSIESNIKFAGKKFASEDITDGQMKKAATIAQAADFISELDEEYEYEIAQGGMNVSGGQRQRLAIARALAKDAPILLFDDSFSALDYQTDLALRKALATETKAATVIIVAQRINTIMHAEQIIVLDEGKIAAKGTHAKLMESCEAYQELARLELELEI